MHYIFFFREKFQNIFFIFFLHSLDIDLEDVADSFFDSDNSEKDEVSESEFECSIKSNDTIIKSMNSSPNKNDNADTINVQINE